MLSEAKEHFLCLNEYYPQRIQRLKGLASYLGTEPLKLQALSIYFFKITKGGCTATFSAPPATRDGGIYLSWNVDLFEAAKIIRYLPLFYMVEIPGYNKYVAFGIPCLASVGLLNELGLSYVCTAVGMRDGGGEGLLDFEINNLCMENCSDANEAVQAYKNTKIYSFPGLGAGMLLNYNCIWGDVTGQGVIIEHSSNHVHYQYSEGGILAITNHHQFLDGGLTGSPDPDELPAISGSYCRLGRAWNLLRENKGNIDLGVVKSIMGDHKLEAEHIRDYDYPEPIDDGTICGHYWNIPDYLREKKYKKAFEAYIMGKTIMALILQVKKFTVWRCIGNPCNRPFRALDFKDILQGHSKKYPNSWIALSTKLSGVIWRVPKIGKFMAFIYKKWSLLFFTVLERLIPVETKIKR